MEDGPSGTVTFLFTDIEGSTRRWEADADAMRAQLAAHDRVLRAAVEAHAGWVFKHTGDGVCAAFGSPRGAIASAVEAQRSLALPVRMGIATGEVERRGEDYFGPALNRAARVMAVGHGGQILVSASTAGIVSGFDLWDLGEHRLRDLSGVEHLFQVRADGLSTAFPPLRTVDAVPGNLPRQTSSFVGREVEVKELLDRVRTHELVTLTGVGGVGKTRLAIQVAAELLPEFPDGVWLVELAPVGDPAAVPDAVATALSAMPQPGRTMTQSIAEALAGRRLLVVLDNCEHVLDAAAELVETVVGRSRTVKFLATSREGLRAGAEHVWPVPSLAASGDAGSGAVTLFLDRAQALVPSFELAGEADVEVVAEICRRLDGIALAIELAAARMVSMSPVELLERLTDRFRLLSGSRRALERHQTLRHAVQWSYDLLNDDERIVLKHCSVFAGGFDLAACAHVCDGFDEYAVLDVLDSLVRKSLVTATRVRGHTRYGMLETIRQFAEEQLALLGGTTAVRDRHARWFADRAVVYWGTWNGPRMRLAHELVDLEFDNLRAGFRWAADGSDLDTAAAIAAHTTMLAYPMQRYEPVGWAEEILDAATTADLVQLPRLYTAAGMCVYAGRPEVALGYAQTALALEADPRREPFEPGWSGIIEALTHLLAGRTERWLHLCAAMAGQQGVARVLGLCGLVYQLPASGRADEAMALADETVAAAEATGVPFHLVFALLGSGRAFAAQDPARALGTFRQALSLAREHRLAYWEPFVGRDLAALEAQHGSVEEALTSLREGIVAFHRDGDHANLSTTLACLAVLFDRIGRPDVAATVYGASSRHDAIGMVIGLPELLDHLRTRLGIDAFRRCGHGRSLPDLHRHRPVRTPADRTRDAISAAALTARAHPSGTARSCEVGVRRSPPSTNTHRRRRISRSPGSASASR